MKKRENGGVTIVGNTSAKIISASIFLLGILEASFGNICFC